MTSWEVVCPTPSFLVRGICRGVAGQMPFSVPASSACAPLASRFFPQPGQALSAFSSHSCGSPLTLPSFPRPILPRPLSAFSYFPNSISHLLISQIPPISLSPSLPQLLPISPASFNCPCLTSPYIPRPPQFTPTHPKVSMSLGFFLFPGFSSILHSL